MNVVSRLAIKLNDLTERFIPSSLSIAMILTIIVFLLGWITAGVPFPKLITMWGNGFWELLSFSMQMSLIILTGYIVASSPPVDRLLKALARLPRTPRGTVALMAFLSMFLAFFHWGLSLIGSAILARRFAARVKGVDYRLLVAVAYFGMGATWHSGLSASAPLLVATPGHFMEAISGIIPVSKTIFSPFNLVMALLSVVLLTVLAYAMHPAPEKTVEVAPAQLEEESAVKARVRPTRLSEFIDSSPILNGILGLAGLLYLGQYVYANGISGLNLNTINFAFLALGLVFHDNPAAFTRAAIEGGSKVYGVIIQFPLYSGMYGIIKDSGLTNIIAQWFLLFTRKETFPLIITWYSGIVNYFVPSGGSKWAIEAPYIFQTAKSLGVSLDKSVVSYAWGDMITDIIQPFWAIPLLSIAKLEFKDILGFCFLTFIVFALLVTAGFLLYGFI